MTQDYGGRRKPAISTAIMIVAGGCSVLAIGIAAWLWLHHRSEAVAHSQAWATEGPPCPTTTAAGYGAFPLTYRKSTEYFGVMIERAGGFIACDTLNSDGGKGLSTYGICQFSAPSVIHVTMPGHDVYYAPGYTRKATISFLPGGPQCVMGAKITDWLASQ
jgi:hypothetical protein